MTETKEEAQYVHIEDEPIVLNTPQEEEEVNEVEDEIIREFGDSLSTVVDDVLKKIEDIPKGNSLYQEHMFVANGAMTPGRMVKAIGLQAKTAIENLRNVYFETKKEDIEIERNRRKIERLRKSGDEDADLDIKKLELENKARMLNRQANRGMVKDQLVSLSYFHEMLKKLPDYTRKSFEKEEEEHFMKRLELSARLGDRGSIESLTMLSGNQGLAAAKQLGAPIIEDVSEFAGKIEFNRMLKQGEPAPQPITNESTENGTDN